MCFTSCVMLLFYTSWEVYTKFGTVSQGTEIHAISQTERALLPAKPSASSYRRKRGALQGTSHARRGKPPRRAPKTGVPHLFTTHPRLFTTHPRLFTTHPAPVYDPSRACLRPIPRLLRLSNACLRTFCTFYAIPRPQKSASHPSRHRLISQTIPQGERRALPAPAQGANPLRIPFWKTTSIASVSPSPKTPQADGPCS